jgi:hypothetical protein
MVLKQQKDLCPYLLKGKWWEKKTKATYCFVCIERILNIYGNFAELRLKLITVFV